MSVLSRLPERAIRNVLIVLCLFAANCGAMEFGLNGETLDVVKCFASGECEIALGDISGDQAESASDEAAPPDDPQDQGISGAGALPPEFAQSELLGTFKLHENFDSCAYDLGNAYAVPAILRLYLDDQSIRFVDLNGVAVWTSAVYPDDTFDFSFMHADTQGDPDNTVSCACALTTGESEEQKDKTACACAPSSSADENCGLDYIAL